MFHVYIFRFPDGSHYTGLTCNLFRRWSEHLKGCCLSTSHRGLPILAFLHTLQSRPAAAAFEKYIKSIGAKRFLEKYSFHFSPPSLSTSNVISVTFLDQ